MDLDKITGDAINFKIHYGFFMDIKKSNVLEDRFKLSSFSLKIYNVNAGNIIYAFGSAHHKFDVCMNRSGSFAVLFDKLAVST